MKRSQIAWAIAAVLSGMTAAADPMPFSDAMLDRVTAGSDEHALQGSGGAIVGNNSEVKLVLTGTLDLDGSAQSGAQALNLVNSSESTVANGVNVWDGKLPDGATAGANGTFDVMQENVVHQEQRRVALLPSYERTGANRSSTWAQDSTLERSSTSSSSTETRALESTGSTRDLTSDGNVDTQSTILGQEIKGGQGFAGAGDLAVDFEAGQIAYTASASVDGSADGAIGGAVDGGISGEITLAIDLPRFTIDLNGAGCAVEIGSCDAHGTLNETSDTLSDHSVIESASSSSDRSERVVDNGSEEVRSPFSLADAQAEYVVVDDSALDVESNYGITLAGSAQSDLRALNAVNAAGSAVANAVNISRTPSLTATASLSLVQSNVIGHSR